jgi:hypothetical protein
LHGRATTSRQVYARSAFTEWFVTYGCTNDRTEPPVPEYVEPVAPPPQRNAVDEYFTLPAIAEGITTTTRQVLAAEGIGDDSWWCEPTAGSGNILRHMPAGRRIGFDLYPQDNGEFGIIQTDYRQQQLDPKHPWVVITNPAFSKPDPAIKLGGCETAFAWAAQQDCVAAIGIITPHWFQGPRTENKLHPYFHRVHLEVLPNESFTHKGQVKYSPTIFTLWVRRPYPREQNVIRKTHPDWEWLPPKRVAEADAWMQMWGVGAGDIKPPDNLGKTNDRASHKFIREIRPGTIDRLKAINWREVAYLCLSSPRLYPDEIVAAYIAAYGDPDVPDYDPDAVGERSATPAPPADEIFKESESEPTEPPEGVTASPTAATPEMADLVAKAISGAQPQGGPLRGFAGVGPATIPDYPNAHIVPLGRGDAGRSQRLREAMAEVVPDAVRFICADFWIFAGDDEAWFARIDKDGRPVFIPFQPPELIAGRDAIHVGKTTLDPMAENDFIRVRSSVNKARRVLARDGWEDR